MSSLAGLRVVSMALNVPGPAACTRLRDLGASVVKVEPPAGDPLEGFHPSWYRRMHEEIPVHRLDLKTDAGRAAMDVLLAQADVLITAQRPAALARLGLEGAALARRHPRLCHVAITGHGAPDEEVPGHDLTYLAAHGLVTPPALPATLFADMAGAERVVSGALALVFARDRGGRGGAMVVPLAEAAAFLALPRAEGLTRPGAVLGGGFAGYNLYAASDGWIAVAALEPHFARKLAAGLGVDVFTVEAVAARFKANTARHWEEWARSLDLPVIAIPIPS
jgi:alpha-methylacyl-CoA racemase